MIRKVLKALHEIGESTGFEMYLRGVQADRRTGAPTRDEANRDFRSIHWLR